MKAREVVGRKIVGVSQVRLVVHGDVYFDVQSIDLDNGKSILFVALETEYEPIVSAQVIERKTT